MDASAAPSETSSAILESPLIPARAYCFEYYYYMYGDDVGGEFIHIDFFIDFFYVLKWLACLC